MKIVVFFSLYNTGFTECLLFNLECNRSTCYNLLAVDSHYERLILEYDETPKYMQNII